MARLIDLIAAGNKPHLDVSHPSGNVIRINENYLANTPILLSDGWEIYTPPLKVEGGKYYITRDTLHRFKCVYKARHPTPTSYPFLCVDIDRGLIEYYRANGGYSGSNLHSLDLIEEIPEPKEKVVL